MQVGPDCTWVKSRIFTPSSALPALPQGSVEGLGPPLPFFLAPFFLAAIFFGRSFTIFIGAGFFDAIFLAAVFFLAAFTAVFAFVLRAAMCISSSISSSVRFAG